MRANLFTFLDYRDPWARDLRRAPKATLLRTLPGLAGFLGDFQVVEGVQNWIMDLCEVENFQREGVVLIGDAFQTSCPAAGTGVSRLLTDVERLCNVHLPHWLASPGMGLEKIDPVLPGPGQASRRPARVEAGALSPLAHAGNRAGVGGSSSSGASAQAGVGLGAGLAPGTLAIGCRRGKGIVRRPQSARRP